MHSWSRHETLHPWTCRRAHTCAPGMYMELLFRQVKHRDLFRWIRARVSSALHHYAIVLTARPPPSKPNSHTKRTHFFLLLICNPCTIPYPGKCTRNLFELSNMAIKLESNGEVVQALAWRFDLKRSDHKLAPSAPTQNKVGRWKSLGFSLTSFTLLCGIDCESLGS